MKRRRRRRMKRVLSRPSDPSRADTARAHHADGRVSFMSCVGRTAPSAEEGGVSVGGMTQQEHHVEHVDERLEEGSASVQGSGASGEEEVVEQEHMMPRHPSCLV